MKRSEINKALRELEAMCEKYKCYLPPFCHFTPEEWKTKGHEYDEVRDCTQKAVTTISESSKQEFSALAQAAKKKIHLCAWISITAVILCALVVLWSR